MKIDKKIEELVNEGLFYSHCCKKIVKSFMVYFSGTACYEATNRKGYIDYQLDNDEACDDYRFTSCTECGEESVYLVEYMKILKDEKGYYTKYDQDEQARKDIYKALKEYALKDMKFKEVEI